MLGENSQPFSYKGQDLAGENLNHKDLRGVDFTNANLEGATFVKANLQGAIFDKACLKKASFRTIFKVPDYGLLIYKKLIFLKRI